MPSCYHLDNLLYPIRKGRFSEPLSSGRAALLAKEYDSGGISSDKVSTQKVIMQARNSKAFSDVQSHCSMGISKRHAHQDITL
jgi:hypothetical protein